MTGPALRSIMDVAMPENDPNPQTPSPSALAALRGRLTEPRALGGIALSAALALAGAAAWRALVLKPERAVAERRYQSHLGLMRLYDLQMSYRATHGTFANDLETLLATAPDGAKIREVMKAATDINTLTVVGDANRFRLEANVLDSERTLVKIRGPLGER